MLSDEERKAKERARWRKRNSDPEKRSALLAKRALRRATSNVKPRPHPEYRTQKLARQRAQYANDASVRGETLERNKQYQRKNWERIKEYRRARHKARYADDPHYGIRLAANRKRSKRNRLRASADDLLAAIRTAIPISYPRHVRDDIAGDMFLAVVAHKLRRKNIPSAAAGFVRAYWKANDPFLTVSIDAPIGDSGFTIGDTLTEEHLPW